MTASDGAYSDNFGVSVAISGDTIVVGSPLDTVGTNAYQGSIYVFVRSGNAWPEQVKLTVSDGVYGDGLGGSVAISGDILAVGAPRDDAVHGAVYVFVRSGGIWKQQAKLTARDGASGEGFGWSVAISGKTLVVGCPFDDFGGNPNRGSAYIFVLSGGAWVPQAKLTVNDGADYDSFGASVAISGHTVVVGAHANDVGAGVNHNQGAAYIFIRSDGVWMQQAKLIASDGAAGDAFGVSVAIGGDTVVVGSSEDDLGPNVDQGSAYVFFRSDGLWSEEAILRASDGAAYDRFGCEVAISGDIVAVGSVGDDIGANVDQGSAYVFLRGGGVWMQEGKLTASEGAGGSRFGHSVAVRGNFLIVGFQRSTIGTNPSQGSAYVFYRGGGVWTESGELVASDGAAYDQFGVSVAISLSPLTVVVGSPADDTGSNFSQGAVYSYSKSTSAVADAEGLAEH